MVFKKRAGVISSVLTLVRSSGATKPVNVVNGSNYFFLPNIDKMTGNGSGSSHSGADKMSASTATLTAFKVAVAGGSAAFTFGELVAVHGNAHTAASLTPFKTGFAKDIGQPFFFSYAADTHRAGDDHGADVGSYVLALDILGSHT